MGTLTNRQTLDHAEPAVDRRRAESQDAAALILARSECLPIPERELLKALYSDGLTALEIGRLQGVSRHTVYRRSQRLVARVSSPLFVFVLRHRDQWPPMRRRIATAIVLHGLTVRQACEELRVSPFIIRKHRHVVLALFEQAASASRAA
jgi:hypothetical protein